MSERLSILHGDALEKLLELPSESVQCCVTSPPYWGLRDYQSNRQIGLEKTPAQYVERIVNVFREVGRVLRKDGTLWLNLGDTYASGAGAVGSCPGGGKQGDRWMRGLIRNGRGELQNSRGRIGPVTAPNRMPLEGIRAKNLIGIPWRVAFALQDDGWNLRQDIIWSKPNPMPESVRDRCTKAHEYIFLLTKSLRYFFDPAGISEAGVYPAGTRAAKGSVTRSKIPFINGRPPAYKICNGKRNKRSVWNVSPKPYPEAHFATFPTDLIEPCILAGSRRGDIVLDPFAGSGTTGEVALKHKRRAILIELVGNYLPMIRARCGIDKEIVA
jgi:DNA modification methylase